MKATVSIPKGPGTHQEGTGGGVMKRALSSEFLDNMPYYGEDKNDSDPRFHAQCLRDQIDGVHREEPLDQTT